MNRIQELFAKRKNNVLSIYCTAGYPRLDSTLEVMKALQDNGAEMIELGMPYSDPLADGPVIQVSNGKALANGMTIATLFDQQFEGRECFHNAGDVVDDHLPVFFFHGNVVIHAQENPFSAHIQVSNSQFSHKICESFLQKTETGSIACLGG